MLCCLDAWAVLEWLRDREPAASRVDAELDQRPLMSWINLGEVSYIVRRESGRARAEEIIAELRSAVELESPSPERVLEAAAIKAEHAISYADCFAVATALGHRAVLLTGDPEILGADPSWPVEDLRA